MALYSPQSIPANIDPTPSSSAPISTVAVGTTPIQVLAPLATRKGFSFCNNSNRAIYLGTGNTVSTTANFFAVIPANGLYEWNLNTVYTGAVFAIANGSGGSLQVLDLT